MYHRKRPAVLMLSAVLALTSIPFAASSAQTRSVRVHSFDLDLSTKTGQAQLQRRIHYAVEQVCGSSGGREMDDIMSSASCRKAAQASAMSQYDVMVSTAHDGKVAADQNRDVIVR